MQRHALIPPAQPPANLSSQEKMTFKKLPAEIRNEIYSLVLPSDQTIKPNVELHFKRVHSIERGYKQTFTLPIDKTLAIARTCRQIHHEALTFYYGCNMFDFESAYDLHTFLYMIGHARRGLIKYIRAFLVHPGFCERAVRKIERRNLPMQEVLKFTFDLLADCASLQKLYLGLQNQTRELTNPDGKKIYCRLPTLRKSGVFDSMRGFEDLDLRIREVRFWNVDWAAVHYPSYVDPFLPAKMVKEYDQFENDPQEEERHRRHNMRFTSRVEKDELTEFERGLKEDMARPKLGLNAGTGGMGTIGDGNADEGEENPLRRAETLMRKQMLCIISDLNKQPTTVSRYSANEWRRLSRP